MARLGNGLPIEVDSRDMIGREIIRAGYWEAQEISFIQRFLRAGMTVVDAGAHIGQHSMVASRSVGPSGRVHAFEPHPSLHDVLQRNLRRAGCSNVTAQRLALGRARGERDLFLHQIGNTGASFLRPVDCAEVHASVRVAATTLDHYLAAHAVGRVDLIKMDVEGAELEVLEGAADTIATNPDIVLIVEFLGENVGRFGYSLEDLASHLRRLGFGLYSVTPRGLNPYRSVGDSSVNVVATRRVETLLNSLSESHAARLLMRLASAQKSSSLVTPSPHSAQPPAG